MSYFRICGSTERMESGCGSTVTTMDRPLPRTESRANSAITTFQEVGSDPRRGRGIITSCGSLAEVPEVITLTMTSGRSTSPPFDGHTCRATRQPTSPEITDPIPIQDPGNSWVTGISTLLSSTCMRVMLHSITMLPPSRRERSPTCGRWTSWDPSMIVKPTKMMNKVNFTLRIRFSFFFSFFFSSLFYYRCHPVSSFRRE